MQDPRPAPVNVRFFLDAERREHKRLARILHDHLQQILVAAKMRLSLVRQPTSHDQQHMAHALDLVDQAISASRSLAVELDPPILQQGGLVESMRWLAKRFGQQLQLPVTVEILSGRLEMPEHILFFLFQAARELLLHAAVQAEVRGVSVRLAARGDYLTLVVEEGEKESDAAVLAVRSGTMASADLSNVRQRLCALGGDLQTDTTPAGSACHRLVVPLAWADEAPDEQHERGAAEAVPPEAGDEHRGRILRVLVADDHNIVREGLVTLLQEERDFEVVGQAADGDEAVEQALATCPDVVIMDVTMPRRDGIEATRMIKQRQPDAVVIGLSFHDDQSIARAMTDAGAAAYFRKDGPSEDLFAAIRQLCCSA